jgi:aspartate racemase
MRTIGLIGGLSWESSTEYYRLLNLEVQRRLGGLHSADCVLRSVDFQQIADLQDAGDWSGIGAVLARRAQELQAAGADLIVLCTNTMHKVSDDIEAAVTIPLLHIGDATARAVHHASLKTVGLLGTAFTMEEDFLTTRLARHGLTVLAPGSAEDRQEIHRVIYEELCLGTVRQESREFYRRTIDELVNDGAEGIVLGCTEIEHLVGPQDSPVPVFPTARIHALAAVETAFAEP